MDDEVAMSQDVRHVCPKLSLPTRHNHLALPAVPLFHANDLDSQILRRMERRPRYTNIVKEFTPPSLNRLSKLAPPPRHAPIIPIPVGLKRSQQKALSMLRSLPGIVSPSPSTRPRRTLSRADRDNSSSSDSAPSRKQRRVLSPSPTSRPVSHFDDVTETSERHACNDASARVTNQANIGKA